MEWQNLRPARARAARLAFLTCALAALALSAPVARGLGAAAPAQAERFEGQWLVEYQTDEGKTSLTLRYNENRGGQEPADSTNEQHQPASLSAATAADLADGD